MTTQDKMLEQVYGILDDWRTQQFGGEPIVDAINNLTAISGTATRQELERIVDSLQSLTEVLARQQAIAVAELGATLQATAGGAPFSTSTDPSDDARKKIRENVEEIAVRMGRRLGTGDEAVEIGPPDKIVLSEFDPILPVPIRPGGDATIYGAGLDAVADIVVDGNSASIGRILSGEVDFTVPVDTSAGVVTVQVFTVDGDELDLVDVPVTGGIYTVQKASRKGVKS